MEPTPTGGGRGFAAGVRDPGPGGPASGPGPCDPGPAPLLLTVRALGLFGLILLSGLAVPAVLTLVRLRRSGPPVDGAPRAG